ncbi:MAG: MFS transporter [Pseudomonadota bacterium]
MTVGRPERSTVTGLIALAIGTLVVAIDFTSLSVAIPAIEQTFDTDIVTAQWVLNIYAVSFGVVIVTAGRLADMFGRRRIFIVGAGITAVASVVGGLAPDIWLLLVCRAIIGIGGALLWPSIIGLTYQIMPAARGGLAGGLIMAIAGFENAVGPFLGGFLTETFSWRWVFFVNAPVALLAIVAALLALPKDEHDRTNEQIDYGGMASLTIGLLAVLLALDWGVERGWTDPMVLVLFVVGAVFLIGFALYETRQGDAALVPRAVMRNLSFAMTVVTVLTLAGIFFSALVYLPQFMAKTLDFTAFAAGAGMLPVMLTYAVMAIAAGKIYEMLGPKMTVSIAAIFLAGGMFWLSTVETATGYGQILPGMIVLGIGLGFFYASITTAGVTALDRAHASLAGGIIYMANVAGGALGLGLNTAIITSASTLPNGIHTAFIVNGVLAIVGLIITLIFIGGSLIAKK